MVRRLLRTGGAVVALVKPQFEAGEGCGATWRVIRDPATHGAVLRRFGTDAAEAGFGLHGLVRSPVTGADGNVEFLAHLGARPGMAPQALEGLIGRLAAPSA